MNIIIFDLDGTCIDSSHRQITKADGSLDIEQWRKFHKAEYINKDTLLPLASEIRNRKNRGDFVVFCTARILTIDDHEFFVYHNILPHHVLCRSEGDCTSDGILKFNLISQMLQSIAFVTIKSIIMFDDSDSVRQMLRGLVDSVIHPNKVNFRRA
jgi:hypothetical protein